ncbi:TolC family protein [Labilibaculum sp.]|uniref:TolC family protein n=1 Tax=Labilibaculum sp. TaxID=2060723 RepID=UPI0035650691
MNLGVRKCKFSLLLVFLFVFTTAWSQQEELSIEQCQNEVQANFPLIKGKKMLQESSNLSVENLKVSYLPQLYANGKFSYQSDVSGISLSGMDIPTIPKDQYSLNLDVEQLIYDGGKTKNRVDVEKKNSEVAIKDLEIQMYQLRERVDAAFFGIQLVRKNKLVILDKKKTISKRLFQIQSAVENGLVLAANLNVLKAELLLIDQQIQELDSYEASSFSALSQLMGRRISKDAKLKMTNYSEKETLANGERIRPEYQFYSSQKSLLDAQNDLLKKDRYPVISAFGELGYGNPGYNLYNDGFDSYYMIGAKLSWNIFDWKSNQRKQTQISIQKNLVDTKELSFTQNRLIELEKESAQINKFRVLLQKDEAIIDLQEQISRSSASQLDNGVITSSDYLDDLNKEIQAKLNKEYHAIQLQQSFANYERIKGI